MTTREIELFATTEGLRGPLSPKGRVRESTGKVFHFRKDGECSFVLEAKDVRNHVSETAGNVLDSSHRKYTVSGHETSIQRLAVSLYGGVQGLLDDDWLKAPDAIRPEFAAFGPILGRFSLLTGGRIKALFHDKAHLIDSVILLVFSLLNRNTSD